MDLYWEKIMPLFADRMQNNEYALLAFTHGLRYVICYCNKAIYGK
jgi:hypothetical protein